MQPTPASQLAVLAVVLDQPQLASDPLLLCSAARVCSSWRAAVAASGAASTDLVFNYSLPEPNLEAAPRKGILEDPVYMANSWQLAVKFTGFADWLLHNGHLIRSMICRADSGRFAARSVAFAHGASADVQLLPRLQCFIADRAANTTLAALPDCLTQLECRVWDDSLEQLEEALKRNKELRVLKLELERTLHYIAHTAQPHSRRRVDLKALGGLRHLTQLQLDCCIHAEEWVSLLQALPSLVALQDLAVAGDFRTRTATQHTLQLRECTALTHLSLQLLPSLTGQGTKLPAQLSELVLDLSFIIGVPCNPLTDLDVRSLQHLRRLVLDVSCRSLVAFPGNIDVLQQITQLNNLELKYAHFFVARLDCRHWGQLCGLASITILDEDDPEDTRATGETQHEVLSAVKGVTGLTCLELTLVSEQGGAGSTERRCHHLSGLTNLRKLCLDLIWGDLAARDCLCLSALCGLTHLCLGYMGQAVGDVVAVALACNMPQLRHLDLLSCSLQTTAVLAPLAQRQGLSQLVVTDNEGFSKQHLAAIKQFNTKGDPSLAQLLQL